MYFKTILEIAGNAHAHLFYWVIEWFYWVTHQRKSPWGEFVSHYRAWNSENRNIFSKPFDSKSRHGSMSQIVQFYDKDIGTGSVLCVYRDPKTNCIHFIINGKKGTVSFSSDAPDFCFGYVYLKSRGSSSEIQVSLQTVIDGGNRSPDQDVGI